MRFPPKVTSSCHTCFLIELIYIGMPVVRTDGHMTTKISRMHRLPMVLRCARARASDPALQITNLTQERFAVPRGSGLFDVTRTRQVNVL